MRKIIAEIAVSLDGYIEGKNGELDWLLLDEGPGYVNRFLSRFEVIFYGRRAYEKLGMFLVTEGNKDVDFPDALSGMRKFVFSRSLRHVPGNGMVINDDIRKNVQRIREEEGKDIWLCGGAELIRSFAMLDLIDEFILAVQPVILGSGKPLFGNLGKCVFLKLQSCERLASGVVVLSYSPKMKKEPAAKRILFKI